MTWTVNLPILPDSQRRQIINQICEHVGNCFNLVIISANDGVRHDPNTL